MFEYLVYNTILYFEVICGLSINFLVIFEVGYY